jgi:hypothetical protein
VRAIFPFVLAGILYSGGVVAQGECLCGAPRSPQAALARADAVFTGRVVSIQEVALPQADRTNRWVRMKVTINVSKIWKGSLPARVEVYTGLSTNECAYPFVRGSNYLIYADRIVEEGVRNAKLSTTTCDRTREYGKAGEDLRALGVSHPPRT